MTIKELKKLLKEFEDEDEVLVEWEIHFPSGDIKLNTRKLEKNDIISSHYDGKTRMIISAY
jgi:hypothetical protein